MSDEFDSSNVGPNVEVLLIAAARDAERRNTLTYKSSLTLDAYLHTYFLVAIKKRVTGGSYRHIFTYLRNDKELGIGTVHPKRAISKYAGELEGILKVLEDIESSEQKAHGVHAIVMRTKEAFQEVKLALDVGDTNNNPVVGEICKKLTKLTESQTRVEVTVHAPGNDYQRPKMWTNEWWMKRCEELASRTLIRLPGARTYCGREKRNSTKTTRNGSGKKCTGSTDVSA